VIARAALAERLRQAPTTEGLMTRDEVVRQRSIGGTQVLTPAAVLLLIINHGHGPSVLLTRRANTLADHAGQISFPGGRAEPGDASLADAALREAKEEVGLDRGRVEVVGELPEYLTSSGYRVQPIVGWAEPPIAYAPDTSEVSEVFEVPLAFLLDPRNHRLEKTYYRGQPRQFWAMPWEGRYIWGATAGMLVTFQRIVAP
jgi:8-oxo-dGTP pyrophosphatase MutT (NUDIX family)